MKKTIRILSLLLSMCLIFSGCTSEVKEETTKTPQESKKKATDIPKDFKLRDKEDLYNMFDPTEVVTMYLTVSRGNEGENTDHSWSEINTYSVYDYEDMGVDRYKVEGLLQVGDENGPKSGQIGYNQISPNCTVQIRGQSSSRNSQKNYKIRLKDNKGLWRGQQTIALNKHQSDGLRFRNKLSYDLIAGIDQLMGLRTTFVHLYVKDTTSGKTGFEDYGLYTQVEQLNKTALKAHGLDKNGHLYKVNLFEFYRYEDIIKKKEDPTYNQKAFEERIEIKGSDDHSKLIKMLEDLNDYSIPADEIIEKHFDIENISYWMAYHMLMGNIDTQSRNFYIYSPLHSDKWYILTWDNDGSLMHKEHEIINRNDYGGWESGISNYWGNVLFQRCLKSEKFRKQLDSAVKDIKSYLTKERMTEMVQKYASVVKPYVYSMPDIMYTHLNQSQYNTVAKAITEETDDNYRRYKESLKKPMPFYIATPRVNNGKFLFEWESSFDFNYEEITYSFELARDVNFRNVILKEENLSIAAIETEKLPRGQYFIRVISTNKSGLSQYAFDYYVTETGKHYGVKCFYVDGKGNIAEDVYVEN